MQSETATTTMMASARRRGPTALPRHTSFPDTAMSHTYPLYTLPSVCRPLVCNGSRRNFILIPVTHQPCHAMHTHATRDLALLM